MVGSDGIIQFRKLLIKLAGSSFTSIEYWERKTFLELQAWVEAFSAEGGADNGG